MYLTLLNNEQKELFLNLACSLSSVDGNFSDHEKSIIEEYCKEMQISFDYEQCNPTLKNVMFQLESISSMVEKRIIIFELVGLGLVDGNFDLAEHEFIYELNELFGLSKDYVMKCEDILQEYLKTQKVINTIVIGDEFNV